MRHLMRNWLPQRVMLLLTEALEKTLEKTMMQYLHGHQKLMKNQRREFGCPVW
jgi:hypothetical protein